ncbi:hypothetical protein GCM10029964_122740 [Kibdelosporangium lantanae]
MEAPAMDGLFDPETGLPGRDLLVDRLDHALVRAGTHGTLVTLVLLKGNAALARHLRATMRADHTVARYAGTVAVIAEHPYGSGETIARRVAGATGATAGWHTSDGGDDVHEMLLIAEDRLSTGNTNGPGSDVAPGPVRW